MERPRREARDAIPHIRYRIEVGREHGVQPGNIVGAIANEAGMDAVHIGRVEIFDTHSFVGLPAGMPKDVYQRLRKAWVCGQQLEISVDSGGDASKRPPPGVKAKKRHHEHKPRKSP
jgi:ATP-dependent RNA helicase DeaD